MKHVKNFILFLFISILLVVTVSANDAVSAYRTDDEAAEILYSLNLFKGTGTDADGNPDFALDRVSTRYEAITMLVRLSGNEEKALTENYEMPFTDVVDWAKPYVAFAYANGYTSGTSATTFSGDLKITEEQFITMLLRILGYDSSKDFAWDNPWSLSDEISLTQGSSLENNSEFTRGNIAILSERALHCTYADSHTSETLMDKVHQHTWDNGAVIVEATTSKEGTMLYTCTVCQVTKNEEIAKLEFVDEALVITDANLEAALRKEINKPTGTLMVSDFSSIKVLILNEKNIIDISALAYLTNLETLSLENNQITDIAPLSQLINLTSLWLNYNNIADIAPLAKLTNLTDLFIYSNNISDIKPLSHLTNLTHLYLNSNNITDISPLSYLPNLTRLNLNLNNIVDISPLSELTTLEWLFLDDNNITDITPLAKLTNLTSITLISNNITDITPLANLTNLRRLVYRKISICTRLIPTTISTMIIPNISR